MTKLLTIITFILLLCSCSNDDAADKSIEDITQWTQDSTSHFWLKAQRGVRSERELAAIGEKMEWIQQDLLEMLQETETQDLKLYLLKDRAALASYTGFPANGYTDTEKGIIYFVDKDPFHLALRHETMHALSWRLWGTPGNYWLSEGLAVYASMSCGGYDLHVLAHTLNKQKKLVGLKNLTENFDFRALEPSLEAASMVKFIYENYGVKALKNLWQSRDAGTTKSFGVAAEQFEALWKKHISGEQFSIDVNFDKIREHGCE